MEMFFVTKVKWSNLLFEGLDINNTAEMVGACILTFVAAVMCEALKLLKTYLVLRLTENPLAKRRGHAHSPNTASSESIINSQHTHDEAALLSSLRIPVTISQIQTRKLVLHLLNTLSHTFNLLWGYMLMLLVMSYSVWLTIAVITGCGAGYFIFGVFTDKIRRMFSPGETTRAPNESSPAPVETVHM